MTNLADAKPEYTLFLNRHNLFCDHLLPVFGSLLLLGTLPFLVAQMAITNLWGLVSKRMSPDRLIHKATKFCDRLSYTGTDGNIFLWFLNLGVALPALWLYVASTGSLTLAVLYNIIRIGPMYMHFAHAYTLSHMEVHRGYKLFASSVPLGYVFTWWVGLFHGVAPGTYSELHPRNHHKYNNDINDMHSNAGYRRDSLWSFARYVIVWFSFASNVSGLWYFTLMREWAPLLRVILGTLVYGGWVWICGAMFGWMFTLITIVYPFFEGNVLLAVVNYTWHMCIQGDNDFIDSTTIENGTEFIFSEEYHVVHHATAGIHHSRYRSEFIKHLHEYDVIFYNVNLFELGVTAMLRDYKRLASMVKQTDKVKAMGEEKLIETLKQRLQYTLW